MALLVPKYGLNAHGLLFCCYEYCRPLAPICVMIDCVTSVPLSENRSRDNVLTLDAMLLNFLKSKKLLKRP